MFFKRTVLTLIIPLLLVGMLAAACGDATTNTGSASDTPTVAPTTAPAPTATSAPTALINTATATVAGKSETILTNAKGFTLYYFTKDTPTTVACTGGCATAWPPLLASGSGTPTSATTLPGTLSVVTGADGAQVEYQGHPLYTFASDTAAGQTSGEGVGGVWHVATSDLQASGSSSVGSGY